MILSAEQIVKRPRALTEKATRLKAKYAQVVFEVVPQANKIQIKAAVEALFDVKVRSVNTLIQRGKMKRMGRRLAQRRTWKKAIVTLAPGDDIQFFEESEGS